jgi:hypothetical protein
MPECRVSMFCIYKDAENNSVSVLYKFKSGEHLSSEVREAARALWNRGSLNWAFAEELEHPGALAQKAGLMEFPTEEDGDTFILPSDGITCACKSVPPFARVEQEVDSTFYDFMTSYERRERAGTAHPRCLFMRRISGEL